MIEENIFIPPVITEPSSLKRPILQKEIKRLLSVGVIRERQFVDTDVVSRVFVVPKQSGDWRMIIDLSELNKKVIKSSFRMEDMEVIKNLISQGDFCASVDLKDAFNLVGLHEDSHRLVVFEFEGKRFSYAVLPFGLSSSPRIFSKVLKVVIVYLRNSGIKISHFLDDIFIAASTYDQCLKDLKTSLNILASLGFVVNVKKSSLIPSKSILHLGYEWNTQFMTRSLPEDKLSAIKDLIIRVFNKPCSLRTHASLLGKLISSQSGFRWAPLHFRTYQLSLLSALKINDSWDQIWHLDSASINELKWWLNCSHQDITPVLLLPPSQSVTLYVDSSSFGWGFYFSSGEESSGDWKEHQLKWHINYLELKTIEIAISKFPQLFQDKSIKIKCDNSTAVSYFNKKGGTHSPSLCNLSVIIWKKLCSLNSYPIASHIEGKSNKKADYLSRFSHFHEYQLTKSAFLELIEQIPFQLDIDLFASAKNAKLPNYVSIADDANAFYIDAFSEIWHDNSYIFPPVPLLQKALAKIQREEVTVLLITPAWDSLSIIPILENLLISSPIFIHASLVTGYLLTRKLTHWMAWPISGSLAIRQASTNRPRMPLEKAFPKQHYDLIWGCGKNLLNGLRNNQIFPGCLKW